MVLAWPIAYLIPFLEPHVPSRSDPGKQRHEYSLSRAKIKIVTKQ